MDKTVENHPSWKFKKLMASTATIDMHLTMRNM